MNAQQAKQAADALLEASKKASRTPWTHRNREEWGYGTKSWVEPISSEPHGLIYASEQTLADHKFVEMCGNDAPAIAQAYLDALNVIQEAMDMCDDYTQEEGDAYSMIGRRLDDFLNGTEAKV